MYGRIDAMYVHLLVCILDLMGKYVCMCVFTNVCMGDMKVRFYMYLLSCLKVVRRISMIMMMMMMVVVVFLEPVHVPLHLLRQAGFVFAIAFVHQLQNHVRGAFCRLRAT